jgi:hypothetical protein
MSGPPQLRHATRIDLFVRAGHVSKGILYCTLGLLAALAAAEGADYVRRAHRPLVLLATLAVAAYAAWSMARALWDPEGEAPRTRAGSLLRVRWFSAGALHGVLAVYGVALLWGEAGGHHGAPGWSARVMAWEPFGAWLVGLGGVALTALSLRRFEQAWQADLSSRIDLRGVAVRARRRAMRLCRLGLAASGLVFAPVGMFLVFAAVRAKPTEEGGFAGALDTMGRLGPGWALLATTAAGLVVHGTFELLEARFRQARS